MGFAQSAKLVVQSTEENIKIVLIGFGGSFGPASHEKTAAIFGLERILMAVRYVVGMARRIRVFGALYIN
jgi:hypothetical protein